MLSSVRQISIIGSSAGNWADKRGFDEVKIKKKKKQVPDRDSNPRRSEHRREREVKSRMVLVESSRVVAALRLLDLIVCGSDVKEGT